MAVAPALSNSDATVAALKAKPVTTDPTLLAGPVSMVNTTTAGDQVLRSIAATSDGGYTVAWMSDNATLFIQHYDSAGNKAGGETAVPVAVVGTPTCATGNCDGPTAIREGSVAVLRDGSVVVAYELDRPAGQVGAFLQFNQGIYIQRFDADGVQLLEETTVFSQVMPYNSRPVFLSDPTVRALTDGGFVVGWNARVPQLTNLSRSPVLERRYDSQATPWGDAVTVGSFFLQDQSGRGFSLVADASGGYTLTVPHQDTAFTPVVSAIHYDASDTAAPIVAPRTGSILLLPLEGDRFVLFTSDGSGTFRQFLDSAGNPLGMSTPIASMPFDARELADGSFVVFFSSNATVTAQRFDSTGSPIGNLLTLQTGGALPGIAALADSGFADAWSAVGTAAGLDVFTQRFIEVLSPDQAALRAKRKACLMSAKGMTGQQRKAFVNACIAA
jgi:hypothetical protein